MQSHLEDVTLQDIADHFGFSLSYCSRLIKSTTGQSFNDWKRLLRIQKAERLLVNTQKSVADISEILGYENPETFIRAFKKELHITFRRNTGAGRLLKDKLIKNIRQKISSFLPDVPNTLIYFSTCTAAIAPSATAVTTWRRLLTLTSRPHTRPVRWYACPHPS